MNWPDFYFRRSLNESSVQDLLVAAHHTMSPADKEKVNQVLSSPTWGDSWVSAVQAQIASTRSSTPQQVAKIMLDGIDGYLRTSVTSHKGNSGRIGFGSTTRQATYTPPPRQNMFADPNARSGPVPDTEVSMQRLSPYSSKVWQGSMADAPPVYPYVYNKMRRTYLYNPNFRSDLG